MTDDLRYKAAVYYVETLGLSVVPIIKGQKRPAIPWTEYQQRRPDKTELVDWFHQGDFQLGVVCGAVSGNLVVLDFETPGAYDDWASRHRDLTKTRTVETGKGVHVYLRLGKPPAGNTKLIPDLVETRGEGGQVLAPPSLHPSGRKYQRRGDVTGILRTTWEDVCRGEIWEKKGRKQNVADAATTIAYGQSAGQRNDSLFDAAVLLRDSGAPKAQALATLLKSNPKNDPPLSDDEIRRTIESAYSRPARNMTAEVKADTFKRIQDRISALREEQASFWLKQATNPGLAEPNWGTRVRTIINDAGALNEVQILELIDEIQRHPPLLKRAKGTLISVWRSANRNLRQQLAGKATDDEIADAYKAEYAGQRMYTRARWYKWNGTGVWTPDADAGDEIWRLMIEFKESDIKPTGHKRGSVEECLKGTSWMGINESKVDAHPHWLNLANCIYDLSNGELYEHAPEHYLTTQLPFEYDSGAECPRWTQFLSEVLVNQDGSPDDEMVRFMAQAFGYSLTAWTKYELSFWLQGGGANGKSTLIHILTDLCGTAAMALNLGMLERDTYQLALLPGIRVITCTESPVGLKVADSTIKSLVSGDRISVRLPYSPPFQLDPIAKIWWAMNNYPRVADTSEGFWRKVKVIPFYASFPRGKRDEDLRFKLTAELPGIFNWALKGLDDLVANGWVEPQAIEEATAAYRRSNDVERAFVDEMCVMGDAFMTSATQLYKEYRTWCIDTGHRPKTTTRVSADWVRLGFERKRLSHGVHYMGIGIKESSSSPLPDF